MSKNIAPDDPHEPEQRLTQYRKNDAEESYFSCLNAVLANAVLPQSDQEMPVSASQLPLIYIVGAPRSGTTLLSQLVSRYLPVGYIDNLIARFWQKPSVGIRLSDAVLGKHKREFISFKSRHGVTTDPAGPHEFGYFWRKWLALDNTTSHKLSPAEIECIDIPGLRLALHQELITTFRTPVVFKNVICGFQAEVLTQAHPASLFIWIKRDPEEVVRSILKCRMERFDRYDAWWSLKPSTYPALVKITSPVAQVFQQIQDCHLDFERSLNRPGVTSMSVDYTDLLNDPHLVLDKICTAIKKLGFNITPLTSNIIPFQSPPHSSLPADMEAELRTLFGPKAVD